MMINHGVTTGALFIVVGIIYERLHSRELNDAAGMGKAMPIFAGFAGVFALHKIRERELAELHDCDARLLEEIPRLRSAILAVADAVGKEDGLVGAADIAEAALWRFGHSLDERDRLARGL